MYENGSWFSILIFISHELHIRLLYTLKCVFFTEHSDWYIGSIHFRQLSNLISFLWQISATHCSLHRTQNILSVQNQQLRAVRGWSHLTCQWVLGSFTQAPLRYGQGLILNNGFVFDIDSTFDYSELSTTNY